MIWCLDGWIGIWGGIVFQHPELRFPNTSYSVLGMQMEDLLAAGVIDPAKVTKNALLNSCSIAGIMLTTQVGPPCFQLAHITIFTSQLCQNSACLEWCG